MNQLDKDIMFLEFCLKTATESEFLNRLNRLTDYLNELKMFRQREMMNVKSELNSVQAQMQLSKSELESYNRWQIAREMQDPSQITKQGEIK